MIAGGKRFHPELPIFIARRVRRAFCNFTTPQNLIHLSKRNVPLLHPFKGVLSENKASAFTHKLSNPSKAFLAGEFAR